MLTHIQYMYVCHFGSCILLQGPEPNTLREVEMKNIWLSVEVKPLLLSPMKYESHRVKNFIFWDTWHQFLSTLRFFSPVDTNLPWSPAALLNHSITRSPGSWTILPPHSPRICNIGILERSQSTHNIPQGWNGNASLYFSSSRGFIGSGVSPRWACVATLCRPVKQKSNKFQTLEISYIWYQAAECRREDLHMQQTQLWVQRMGEHEDAHESVLDGALDWNGLV